METINQINSTAKLVSKSKFEQLQVEEQLLTMLVRNASISMKIKTEAFIRIKQINKQQLKILGSTLD